MIEGRANSLVAPYVAGAKLFALNKPDGGIRQIAVRESMMRLPSKVLCKEVSPKASAYFWPMQLGVGCAQGTELAVHSVRSWCNQNEGKTDRFVLKLDFANAFNTIDRLEMFNQLHDTFPELEAWVKWCYGEPS